MKQLLEFIPLVLFFITYKMFGVREAAIVLVIATIIQMVVLKLKYGMIEKQQKIMAIAVVFFGLLTAYFNEIKYLQWKVTIINALLCHCFIGCTIPIQYTTGEKVIRQRNPITG